MSRVDWRKCLGWTEEHLEELRFAGFAYIRQGKYDIALPFFEALVILDPTSAYDAQTLGAIYLQLNETKKAIATLDRALQLETDHSPTLLNLTKAFLVSGRKEEGLKLAHLLTNDENQAIANTAKALILAYE